MTTDPYVEFLIQLFSNGRLILRDDVAPTSEQILAGQQVAEALESEYRLELAGIAPPFRAEPFNWAAVSFYRAAQFILFRDHSAESVRQTLEPAWAGAIGHSEIYSIDFVFRFLPDLLQFSRHSALGDCVTTQIEKWLTDWPLSNAGTPSESFSDHPALCRIYVDRLLETSGKKPDLGGISDARIVNRIQSDFGQFEELLTAGNRNRSFPEPRYPQS